MEAEFHFGSDPSVEGIDAFNIVTPSTDRSYVSAAYCQILG
jgi:hypothetical protein